MVWLGSFFSRAPTAANDEDDDDDAVLPLPTAVPAAAVAEPNADIDEKTTTTRTSASRTGKGADEAQEGELERSHCRVWQQHVLLFSFSHLPAAAVCLFSPSPVATTVYLSSRPTACLFSPPPTVALPIIIIIIIIINISR